MAHDHETVHAGIQRQNGQRLDFMGLDDEQLGQLALRHTRPADRDARVWEALCATDCLPRVVSVLQAMKARNAAAISARQFPVGSGVACSGAQRRALAQAQRQWHSRATKFAKRVDAALSALTAEDVALG